MPTTKRTGGDDEVLAEQWMLTSGYVSRPPSAQDPYQIRRIMRMCFANGVTMGRQDGLRHPHFTRDEILKVVAYAFKVGEIQMLPGDVKQLLQVLFPEATFDE